MRVAPNFRNLTGQRYGRLIVVERLPSKNGHVPWRCHCDCGTDAIVLGSNLRSGRQKSCGCLNNEKRLERNAARRTTDERKLEMARARGLKWARANKDKSRAAYDRAKSDPEKWEAILERARSWNRRNPDHKNAMTRNRRAKIRGADGEHSKQDIAALFAEQAAQCAVCRCDIAYGYHVDHIMPVSRGGRNDKSNLQLLCASCNLRKGARVDFSSGEIAARLKSEPKR
jgi:5-methylcytosine-specific restriction endonuclease McrA